jgi:hypothetical protein
VGRRRHGGSLAAALVVTLTLALGCEKPNQYDPDRDGDAGVRTDTADVAGPGVADAPQLMPTDSGTCPPGTHRCAGACVDDGSILYCGSACAACPAIAGGTATCEGGQCRIQCPAGKKPCLTACIDQAMACTGTCDPGRHACGGLCADNNSVASCGTSCTPCPAPPAGATAICDGTMCGFACPQGQKACADQCIPQSACCTDADCPMMQGRVGRCDSSTRQCSYTCAADMRPCGTACVPATGCCTDSECPGNFACSGNACSTSACRSGYERCGNTCIRNTACCNDDGCKYDNGLGRCNAGACELASCSAGYYRDGSACRKCGDGDGDHCGPTCAKCGTNEACMAGQCKKTCGGDQMRCCGGACDSPDLACSLEGICTKCGWGYGANCCAGQRCDRATDGLKYVCDDGLCVTCGAPDRPCCNRDITGYECESLAFSCFTGTNGEREPEPTCRLDPCGDIGQGCCHGAGQLPCRQGQCKALPGLTGSYCQN